MPNSSPPVKLAHARLQRLEEIAGATSAMLWLVDTSTGSAKYLFSYFTEKNEIIKNNRKSLNVNVGDFHNKSFQTSTVIQDIEIDIRISIDSIGLKETNFVVYPILFPSGIPDYTNSLLQYRHLPLGFLVLDIGITPANGAVVDSELQILALEIELTRHTRIIEAIKLSQQTISNSNGDVNESISTIGKIVKTAIGANGFIYMNNNNSSTFDVGHLYYSEIRHPLHKKKLTEYFPSELDENTEIRKIILYSDTDVSGVEAIAVPLLQSAYRLKSTPFTEASEFMNKLERVSTNDVNMFFAGKLSEGYENSFRDADLDIARRVFGYIGHYASAKIFERNYRTVMQYLRDNADNILSDPANMLVVLQGLSTSFRNIFIVSSEPEEAVLQIEVKKFASSQTKLTDEYLVRLKNNYLERFNAKLDDKSRDIVYIGIDFSQEKYNIEVHFPGNGKTSNLFILEYEGRYITESIIRSLLHLFSELQVRSQKNEHKNERASYLMQVRHAVIHHFSAANKSMKSLQKLWDRGLRNIEYWNNLRSDPTVTGVLDRSIWSLSQAGLIIENGRFLIGELEPNSLNRKPFRINDVIRDCLLTLRDQRLEKSILVVSKTSGLAPQVMNADEPLMKIAMLNLFDNALKYSTYNKKLLWSIKYEARQYRFEITSAGDPLDKRRREILFQVGTRGKQRDRLNQRHGTGLGLPVAYKILKAHSASSNLDYTPEDFNAEIGGSANTFFFEMPYLTGSDRAVQQLKEDK